MPILIGWTLGYMQIGGMLMCVNALAWGWPLVL